MKFINRFFYLCSVLCALCPAMAMADGPLTGTAGSNLTAFNGAIGSMNNNTWNQLMNTRPAPTADFGNCNALILRCAQPKCATGGCISMEIAYPIVYGCVMANDSCKGHGDALISAISAQIVANSTARANAATVAAGSAAADAVASQSAAQMQQMQMQMQQMQQQMAAQAEQSALAMQNALAEQRQLAEQQAAATAAQAAVAATTQNSSDNVDRAAALGVSADILAREQASGKIMTQLENAEVALKTLKKTMQNTFDYAGCDANGNNCTGPKRVRAFKQKAGEFFDPYETVLDEVYDSLIMAQSLGVDITDIYMMLNGSCNTWGKYLCQTCPSDKVDTTMGNTKDGEYTCEKNGDGPAYYTVAKVQTADGSYKVAPRQQFCQLTQMLTNQDEVQQNWLDMGAGSSGGIRVACASDAIENSVLFRGRKKQASIDIETLQRMIDQDAPTNVKDSDAAIKFCALDDRGLEQLEKAVNLKNLPASVCITDDKMQRHQPEMSISSKITEPQPWDGKTIGGMDCNDPMASGFAECKCLKSGGDWRSIRGCFCNGKLSSSGECESKFSSQLPFTTNTTETIQLKKYGTQTQFLGCSCINPTNVPSINSCECP